VSREPGEQACELRANLYRPSRTERESPEAVAAAANEFITRPLLLGPHRIGKRLLPPMDNRFTGSTTRHAW